MCWYNPSAVWYRASYCVIHVGCQWDTAIFRSQTTKITLANNIYHLSSGSRSLPKFTVIISGVSALQYGEVIGIRCSFFSRLFLDVAQNSHALADFHTKWLKWHGFGVVTLAITLILQLIYVHNFHSCLGIGKSLKNVGSIISSLYTEVVNV